MPTPETRTDLGTNEERQVSSDDSMSERFTLTVLFSLALR